MISVKTLSQRQEAAYPLWWGKPALPGEYAQIKAFQDRENESYSAHTDSDYKFRRRGYRAQFLRQEKLTSDDFARRCSGQYESRLNVKVYAHDRIVVTAYSKPPAAVVSSRRGKRRASSKRGRASFSKRAETRRAWKIGGRLRFRPADNKFTVQGRNMVMDGAHIVETCADGIGVFATTTIAGGTREAYEVMSAASGYIADRLNRWLRYKVQNGYFVYVWELQQRGAPHMHYCFRLPGNTDLDAFRDSFRAEWRKILLDVSKQSGVDLFARLRGGTWRDDPNYPNCDVRVINREYGRYIAKYASKKRSKTGKRCYWAPGRWWAVSRPLRQAINRKRLKITANLQTVEQGVELALSLLSSSGDLVKSSKWASLPDYVACKSVSITVATGTGRALALAMFYLLEEGAVDVFESRLNVIRSNIMKVNHHEARAS